MKAFLGNILHILEKSSGRRDLEMIPNGYILCDAHGKVTEVGRATQLKNRQGLSEIIDYSGRWLLPGFVDTHVHYPQMNIIGSYGEELLEWLQRYTFPEEEKFADEDYAEKIAQLFCKSLLANGTTTAAVYGTSHLAATQILIRSMQQHGISGWIGKSSMDRNGPESLLVPVEQDVAEIELLREEFTGRHRSYLALTPRFAPACSDAHLRALGDLKVKYPELKIQTHYAENKAEIEWVRELFPQHNDYLHVYADHGLLGDDTLLAHGIHIDEQDCRYLADKGVAISHCPGSNMFLGSGLFPGQTVDTHGVNWSLGSDVGAGTSFSMWRTMSDCYKVQKLTGYSVCGRDLLYRATVMAAKTLGMDQDIGNFLPGKYCDLQVINPDASPFLASRLANTKDEQEWLFAMITLADDRVVEAVYTSGCKRTS